MIAEQTFTDIKLPYPLAWQQKVLAVEGNCVIFGGRRLGKTQTGVYKILMSACDKMGLFWWVGLSWRSASLKRAWRLLKFYARKIWRAMFPHRKDTAYIREADKEITLPNGSAIWMRTAERPDSLAGEAVDGVVVDEFSLMPEIVWTEYLEATLADRRGWAMFIAVPKGVGWHSELWNKALTRKGWYQFCFPTSENPLISKEWLQDVQENSTQELFDQEYLAKVIQNEGSVFKGVYDVCILRRGWQDKPQENHIYVAGLDWAKQNDFTVLSVIDALNYREVELYRIQDIDFRVQINKILERLNFWKPLHCFVEMNGIGEMPFQELRKQYNRCEGWYTTQDTKELMITGLAHAFETTNRKLGGGVLLLDDKDGISEALHYYMERLPSGKWRYNAQDNHHDDTVIARALAWQSKLNYRRTGGIHV